MHGVVRALENGTLGGAALDVVDGEPEVPPALLRHPGVILTPHVAFSSDASMAELRRRGALDVVRVLSGQNPGNPCNEPRRT